MVLYEDAPKAPRRIPGPIPFDRGVFGSGSAESVSVEDGPLDTARIHSAILREGGEAYLPEMAMPPPIAPPPPDMAMADPEPEAPPSDPSLMSFAVPDGGPPPANDLEASLMDGILNGPSVAGVRNPR